MNSPGIGRSRFLGRVNLGLLVVLVGAVVLLLLKGMLLWRVASRPPHYTSLASVVVTESSSAGSATEDMYRWVIDTLDGPYLQERVEQRVQALHPELLPMDLDVVVQRGKMPGDLNIFVVSKNAQAPEVYLEGALDELMIIQAQSPIPGALAVLHRPTLALKSESSGLAKFIQRLFSK